MTFVFALVLVTLAARVAHRLFSLVSENQANKVCDMHNGVTPTDYRLFCVCDLLMLLATAWMLISGWQGTFG